MDCRAPESLVDIDVAEPCDRPLVEQRRLHGSATALQPLRQPAGREAALQRLDPELLREVRLELARLEQEPRAEASDIAVGDVRPVV